MQYAIQQMQTMSVLLTENLIIFTFIIWPYEMEYNSLDFFLQWVAEYKDIIWFNTQFIISRICLDTSTTNPHHACGANFLSPGQGGDGTEQQGDNWELHTQHGL